MIFRAAPIDVWFLETLPSELRLTILDYLPVRVLMTLNRSYQARVVPCDPHRQFVSRLGCRLKRLVLHRQRLQHDLREKVATYRTNLESMDPDCRVSPTQFSSMIRRMRMQLTVVRSYIVHLNRVYTKERGRYLHRRHLVLRSSS